MSLYEREYDWSPYTDRFIFERSIPLMSSVPEYVYFVSSLPYTTFMLVDVYEFSMTFTTALRMELYFFTFFFCSVLLALSRYFSMASSSLTEYIVEELIIVKYDLLVMKSFIILRL